MKKFMMKKFILLSSLIFSFKYLISLNMGSIYKIKNEDEFINDINNVIKYLVDTYLSTFSYIEIVIQENAQLNGMALSKILNDIKFLENKFYDKYKVRLKKLLSGYCQNCILKLLLSLRFFDQLNICSLYQPYQQLDFLKNIQDFIKEIKGKCFYLIAKNGYLDLFKKHKNLVKSKNEIKIMLKEQKKTMESFFDLLKEDSGLVRAKFLELICFDRVAKKEFILCGKNFSEQKKKELIYRLLLTGLHDGVKEYYERCFDIYQIIKNDYTDTFDL